MCIRDSPSGLHVMQMPTGQWTECVSAIGASGVHLLLTWRARGAPSPPGHPMVPMLTVAMEEVVDGAVDAPDAAVPTGPTGPAPAPAATAMASAASQPYADVLLQHGAGAVEWGRLVLDRVCALASGSYVPITFANANVDFQIARGNSISL